MINQRLLLTALLWAGSALFVFELIWYQIERRLKLLKDMPSQVLEDTGVGFFISRFIMQLAFLVVVPTVAYSWFYVLVPFYGVRAGVAMAIFIFVLGVVPFAVTVLMRIKLPLSFMLFQMAGYLLKIIIVYGIVAYLYIL